MERRQTTPTARPAQVLATALVGACLALGAAPGRLHADDLSDAQKQGVSLVRGGKPAEALPYLRKALNLAEARQGPDAPATAYDLNNLAEAARLAHRYDEAEPLYRRAIAIDDGKAGDKIGLATSLNNLALVYRAQGRMDEAEPLYLRALTLLEKQLGPTDPDVARCLNNLAVLYRTRGEPEKSRPLLERALAIADKSLGPRSAVTQTLHRNLALLDGKAPGTPAAAAKAAVATPKLAAAPPDTAPVAAAAAIPVPTPAPRVAAAAPPAPEAPAAPAAKVAASSPSAASRPAAKGGITLHVGSVRSQAEVADEWQRLLRRHPDLAELALLPPQRIDVAGKGTFWRVMAGGIVSADAGERTCAGLHATGDSCRVVTP